MNLFFFVRGPGNLARPTEGHPGEIRFPMPPGTPLTLLTVNFINLTNILSRDTHLFSRTYVFLLTEYLLSIFKSLKCCWASEGDSHLKRSRAVRQACESGTKRPEKLPLREILFFSASE